LSQDEKALPPILYSFPGRWVSKFIQQFSLSFIVKSTIFMFTGSGNTWTRLLIDFSTGIYTGTILAKPKSKPNDGKLPGQGFCTQKVTV
jgi:hypothetical protein